MYEKRKMLLHKEYSIIYSISVRQKPIRYHWGWH